MASVSLALKDFFFRGGGSRQETKAWVSPRQIEFATGLWSSEHIPCCVTMWVLEGLGSI